MPGILGGGNRASFPRIERKLLRELPLEFSRTQFKIEMLAFSRAASVGIRMEQYSWFDLSRIAMLEIDSSKVAERVALAREKLRMQMAGLDADEVRAMMDALNNLHAVELREKS